MYEGFGMGFGGGLMWIFWILLIVLMLWAVKAAVTASNGSSGHRSPREILDDRFARGEIDEDEYRRRRQELER
jgi:putative membrane protein